jgi:uncharacterized protein YoxC
MLIEIEVGILALAVVVLVGFLVPVLIHLRKTAEESARLMQRMNENLPVLLREATQAAENMNRVALEVREGAVGARALGHAMGELGQTISNVNGFVRGKGSSLLNVGSLFKAGTFFKAGTMLMNLRGLGAGVRAALGVLKDKSQSHHHQGGSSNGG